MENVQPECPTCKKIKSQLTEEAQLNDKLWLCSAHYLKQHGANFGKPPKGWPLD
jgi:hypothetical protein